MGCFPSIKSLFVLLLVFRACRASTLHRGLIYPGFEGSQMEFVDHKGLFLLSNNSVFGLGFVNGLDVTPVLLVVIHLKSTRHVWTANRGSPVKNDDKFVFDRLGNAFLQNEKSVVWSTGTRGEGVTVMELRDTGNLVLLGENGRTIWQSFHYPTDTLLPSQQFIEGMKLTSFPKSDGLNHSLEIKRGDMILYAGYPTPQIYWSLATEDQKDVKKTNGIIYSASLVANSWNFYDRNQTLVWQLNFSHFNDPNATWAIVLFSGGSIHFFNLQKGKSGPEPLKIPQGPCSTPEPCNPYEVCSLDRWCQCPSALKDYPNCTPQLDFPCNSSKSEMELFYVGERLDYFALRFLTPLEKTHLNACKEACTRNCSCLVLFFDNTSGNCFLLEQIGSLQRADTDSTGFISFVKVLSKGKRKGKGKRHVVFVVAITVATALTIVALLSLGVRFRRTKRNLLLEPPEKTPEEDNFFDTVSGMPVRFSYNDLCNATKNFSVKLGQGGFGSVYHGTLLDGTQVAVKKLESIGQGLKEFRAEVSIIGSIHHVHLVKLKGFCSESTHRLLVYEYMGKGSLDRWIFKNNQQGHVLDWETRFDIALGMAKGLAYLHEECDVKIIHCDIKPENVLLDDNFIAKVSDFGLAKLMTREQSQVFTAIRGTRGYLAPEWITNQAISEKSDVYSFGMVMLEIIGEERVMTQRRAQRKPIFRLMFSG
ncbi:Non-specific serine/threonine protein kinase [Bertholletia excelsa]